MADQQMDSFDLIKEEIERKKVENRERIRQEQLQQQKEEREKNFNEGLIRLAERVMEYEQMGDQSTYFVLKTFLDLAVEIQELMKNLNSISDAMYCLTEAIGFIDNSMKLDDERYTQSLAVKYGFFQRMKQKKKAKKAIKNNAARIQSLVDNISMKYEMASSMTQAMAKLGVKIKMKTEKVMAKSKARADKQGLGGAMQQTASKGDRFLEKLRAEKAGAGEGSAPVSGVGKSDDGASGVAGFDGLL